MADDHNLQSHKDTWSGFLKLIWVSAAFTAILLSLMAYFLV
ncbi:MAG: aa3-type cytochrome c oxidase subunit IV [Alphaproteobacteria bacterium]|nr:aa3-type cytochrome c oxidase subunit IV [Alphaproteobacteria bacterium]